MLKYEQLVAILRGMGVADGDIKKRNPHQVMIPCPLAPWLHQKKTDAHPSMSIRFADPSKATVYYCFACKEQGKFWNLVHTLGSLSGREDLIMLGIRLAEEDKPSLGMMLAVASEAVQSIGVAPEAKTQLVLNDAILKGFVPVSESAAARHHLDTRKSPIPLSVAEDWCLKYDPVQGRIVFPVRNRAGQLVGAVGRGVSDSVQPKYFNYFGVPTGGLLGGLHRLQGCPRVGILEGFFDLVNAWRWADGCGLDLVCTFTAATTDAQADMIAGLDATVLYMYDLDTAGQKGAEEACRRLRPVCYGLRRVTWDDQSIDIGDMDMVQFKKLTQ